MINFNGKIVNESNQLSNNRGFLFGDAVFETLRVISNYIPFWEDHYFRLMASMRVLRFNIPDNFTPEFLKNQILQLHSKCNLGLNSRIRITVFRNSAGRYKPITNEIGYVINIDRIEDSKYFVEKKDVKVALYKDYYISNQLVHSIKSNNKSINVLASIFASENDLDNCILLNDRKMVCEFNNGNLFYEKKEKIYTPDLKSGCLNGVLRKNLINIIKSNGLVIEESQISPFDLVSADELFITNVIQGILPVTNYRKKIYVSKIAAILTNLLNNSINYN